MKKLLLLLLVFLATATVANAQTFTGKCIRVVDGDTYIFATAKDTLRIRDAYMNTPEPKNSVCSTAQPYSAEASAIAKKLLLGNEFKIRVIGTDIYGRKLAYASLADIGFYHRYMITNGYAWSYQQSGANYKLQQYAKKNEVGLWQDESAINPSVWLKTYNTHKK